VARRQSGCEATVAAVREEGGKHFVDLTPLHHQSGCKEVASVRDRRVDP